MFTKGFRVSTESNDDEKKSSKLGLAGNKGSYGESVIRLVKREISFSDKSDVKETDE